MSCSIIGGRLAAFVLAAGVSATASATAQRTFVASTGNDANPCSILQPCRTFAAAVANTSVNGEVIVQDSAGYGPVTITQSVTIVAPAGVYAGVSVFSGEGVSVNGAGIVVTLRGLTINGQGGADGIAFHQGAELNVEDCEVANLSGRAIFVGASGSSVAVKNSVLHHNAVGFAAFQSLDAALDRVYIHTSQFGVFVDTGSRVAVSNSVLANNTIAGAVSHGYIAAASLIVSHSLVTGNPTGLYVDASPGNFASLVSDGNAITYSSTAAFQFKNSGGTEVIYSPGNNTVGFFGTAVLGGALTPLGPM